MTIVNINYSIKREIKHNGKIEFVVYENNNRVDSFISYERASTFLVAYKEAMR